MTKSKTKWEKKSKSESNQTFILLFIITMDLEDLFGWVFWIFLFIALMSLPVLIGFAIYKDLHCWGLDPATAPIECQTTKTINFNWDLWNNGTI